MATSRANTVVTSAPETPGAIAARSGFPAAATPAKVSITPQTVPNNPRNGAPATAVESRIIWLSRARPHSPTARSIVEPTARSCDGLMRPASSRREANVSSTSVEPSRWNNSSSQPAS